MAHCGLRFWDLDIKLDAAAIDGVAKAQLLTHNTVSVFGETLAVFFTQNCPFTFDVCPYLGIGNCLSSQLSISI